jgi:hypothetical protein
VLPPRDEVSQKATGVLLSPGGQRVWFHRGTLSAGTGSNCSPRSSSSSSWASTFLASRQAASVCPRTWRLSHRLRPVRGRGRRTPALGGCRRAFGSPCLRAGDVIPSDADE